MNYVKSDKLELMKMGDPYRTSENFNAMLKAQKDLIKHFKNHIAVKEENLLENNPTDIYAGKIIIDEKTRKIVQKYLDSVKKAKISYIRSTVAFEFPAFSSSFTSAELKNQAKELMKEFTSPGFLYQEPVFESFKKDNGEEKVYLNLNRLFKPKNIYVTPLEKKEKMNEFRQNAMDNIHTIMTSAFEYEPFSTADTYLKEQVFDKQDTTDFLKRIKIEKEYCEYFEQVKDTFKKISKLQGTKIVKSLVSLSQEYGHSFHIAPSINERDTMYVSLDDYKKAVELMEDSCKVVEKVYGKRVVSLPSPITIVSSTSKNNGINGYFLNVNSKSFSKGKLIGLNCGHLTKTTLLHELAHCRDAITVSPVKNIIDEVHNYRKDNGLTKINKRAEYLSEEFMKELLWSSNETHKYSSYIDKIDIPIFQELMGNAKSLFNLQMFGKKDVSKEDIAVTTKYKEAVIDINNEVAETSFESLLNSQELRKNAFFKAILQNKELREKMLKIWKKHIESSGLAHIAIANIKNEEKNEIEHIDLFKKSSIYQTQEDKITFLSTEKRKNPELITSEKNFFVNELKRVHENFLDDAKKYCILIEQKDMEFEINKLLRSYGSTTTNIEAEGSLLLSKEFDKLGIKSIVDKLNKEDIPTSIAFFKEQDIVITPINLKRGMVGIEEIYKKEGYDKKNEIYLKSGREIFARNTENLYYSIDEEKPKTERNKPKTNSFLSKAISLIKTSFVAEKIEAEIQHASNAIVPHKIEETVQRQMLEVEEKISQSLKQFAQDPEIVKTYLQNNQHITESIINFGMHFNMKREMMLTLSENIFNERKIMDEVFKNVLNPKFKLSIDESKESIKNKVKKILDISFVSENNEFVTELTPNIDERKATTDNTEQKKDLVDSITRNKNKALEKIEKSNVKADKENITKSGKIQI